MRHFLIMCVYAAIVAFVFGAIGRETMRAHIIYGLKVFGEFVGIALLLGWALYFLPH